MPGKGWLSANGDRQLLLLANRALDRGNCLELLLGVVQFPAQALVLGLNFGNTLTCGLVLVARGPRRRLSQAACFRADDYSGVLRCSDRSSRAKSPPMSGAHSAPEHRSGGSRPARDPFAGCPGVARTRPKRRLLLGPGVSCAADLALVKDISLLAGVAGREFVEFLEVLVGIGCAENHSFVSGGLSFPRSQSVAFDAVAQPDASETMTATAATRANRIVIVLLSICRQLLFRHIPLLRDMNPEMRARKLVRVDQFDRAIVRLDTLQNDRQPDARAADLCHPARGDPGRMPRKCAGFLLPGCRARCRQTRARNSSAAGWHE